MTKWDKILITITLITAALAYWTFVIKVLGE